MSFNVKSPATFPYQIQPGVDTWNLIDMRNSEVVESRPRGKMGDIDSAIHYGELAQVAQLKKDEYLKHTV
mgnify:CR=1 FL=1